MDRQTNRQFESWTDMYSQEDEPADARAAKAVANTRNIFQFI